MTPRQQFYERRKASIKKEYKELKAKREPKLTREEILDTISNNWEGLAHGTIMQIVFNPKYHIEDVQKIEGSKENHYSRKKTKKKQ